MMFYELLARFLRAVRNFATVILEALLTGRSSLSFYESPPAARFAKTAVILPAAGMLLFLYVWPVLVDLSGTRANYKRQLIEADRLHLTPEILDARDRFIAAPPYFNLGKAKPVEAYFGRLGAQSDEYWNTVFVESPNPDFIACVVHLEDRHHANWLRNPHGVDVTGLLRIGTDMITKRSMNPAKLGGGSTLTAQFQQQIGFDKYTGNARWRKLKELAFRTPDMADVLANDRQRYKQFAARVLPHVSGVSGHGDTVHGIGLSSRLLFGKTQERLTTAEAYLLAATVWRPAEFAFKYDAKANAVTTEGSRARRTKWGKIVDRARRCAAEGPLRDEAHRNSVIASLDGWSKVLPMPKGDPVVNAYGRFFHARTRGNPNLWYDPARDPLDHGSALMEQSLNGLRTELRNAFGYDWGPMVSRVQLSMDIRDERRFVPTFQARAKAWLRGLEAQDRLNRCYRDWAHWTVPRIFTVKECHDIPEVIVAAASEDGRIIRYYSSRDQQSYFGSESADTKLSDLNYDASKETRQLASIAKIGAALAFVRAGVTDTEVRRAIATSNTDEITRLLSTRVRNLGVISEELFRQLRWSHSSSQ